MTSIYQELLQAAVVGIIMFVLSQIFSNSKRAEWPTKVDEAEALRLYANSKYSILAIVPWFFVVPILGYLIGYATICVNVYFMKGIEDETDLSLHTDPFFNYIVGVLVAFAFVFQISDCLYKRAMGTNAYDMYLVAQSIINKMNAFEMQKYYHYFTIFMLTLATAFYIQLKRTGLTAHDTHVEVQYFFALSPQNWKYEDIDSVQYSRNYGIYKIKYKPHEFISTELYDQKPIEKIRRTAAYIAIKANIKIDTVADYSTN